MVAYQAESQLISILEKEALSDLNSLDLPSLNEAEIKLHHVRAWYFETYRDKLSFLPSTLSSQLAIEIQAHLQHIQDARFDALSRIEYYACVREDLISGLKLGAPVLFKQVRPYPLGHKGLAGKPFTMMKFKGI